MKSVKFTFNKISSKHPYWSSYTCFMETIRDKKYSITTNIQWFYRLVNQNDYSKKERMQISNWIRGKPPCGPKYIYSYSKNRLVGTGISNKEYNLWKNRVFERDKHKCRICSETNLLFVHHIKSFKRYPNLRINIDNGIILCYDCHQKVHRGEIILK